VNLGQGSKLAILDHDAIGRVNIQPKRGKKKLKVKVETYLDKWNAMLKSKKHFSNPPT
jgi:hypothetical protein